MSATVDPWRTRPVYAGVLIGGASTRMGRPKATLRLGGQTFVERIVTAIAAHVERIVLLGEPATPTLLPDVPRVPDVSGLAGPLAGILAALRWAPHACWVVAACDLPLVRGEAVGWLRTARAPAHWAILPRLDEQHIEPLLAIYEPESAELIEDLLAAGVRSPHRLAGRPRVYTPEPPADLRACWTNVNTPADLARLICDEA